MVVKLHSKFAEVQYVELLLKKLKPQFCFMCLSEIFSRFWHNYFNFRHACGNWILCVMRNFLSNFFLFKNCFLSELSSNVKQKNFQISGKNFCSISNTACYSFWWIFWCEFLKRVHSDESFKLWRERTKTIWLSKWPPFFWELHSVFPDYHLRFFG